MDSQTASTLSTTIQEILRVEGDKQSPTYIDVQNNLRSILTAASHVVFGRRGTGKSALLAEAIKQALSSGTYFVRIDCEELKNHHFPDVIIEILRSVFLQLGKQISFFRHPFLRWHLYQAKSECDKKLKGQLTGRIQKKASSSAEGNLGTSAVGVNTSRRYEESEDIEYSKLEEIYKRIPRWKELLKSIGTSIPLKAWYLFIDDFYQLPSAHHAQIVDVIHGLCKGTKLYFKLATIRQRTRLYVETDSKPIGVQPRNDYTPLALDFSLENFDQTKDLLWKILIGIAQTCSVEERDLKTIFRGKGFDRLVWATGGVPRDFLTSLVLHLNALSSEPGIILGKDDVRELAAKGFDEKMADLRSDSTGTEVSLLMSLFEEIKNFCLEDKQKNLFSVNRNAESIDPTRYTAFLKLVDSRLVHLISSSRSHKSIPGEVFDIYCLDLGAYAHLRKLLGKLDEVDLTDNSPNSVDIIRQAPVFPLPSRALDTSRSA